MKYLDEFRDPSLARRILDEIHRTTTRPWVIMEICGGQTHSIVRNGIDQLLPTGVELVHGPGCPVCVTSLEMIDKGQTIAARPDVIFTSFGDMLRVPGSHGDLFSVRSQGGDVRIVLSPLDALNLARANPSKQVVFFAVGFETTTPHTAMAVVQAQKEGLSNFSVLAAHVLVPPALRALAKSPLNRVNGYLLAGHVCSVMGWREYESLAAELRTPMVVTGFEPLDLLSGILGAIKQLEDGICRVENQYPRVVTKEGNLAAQEAVAKVYELCDRKWRGIGTIPHSGLKLRKEFESFDAERRFVTDHIRAEEPPECITGLVLQGLKKPFECAEFGKRCTPQSPLGATMVSSEGACAAYYAYHRHRRQLPTESV